MMPVILRHVAKDQKHGDLREDRDHPSASCRSRKSQSHQLVRSKHDKPLCDQLQHGRTGQIHPNIRARLHWFMKKLVRHIARTGKVMRFVEFYITALPAQK